MTTARRVVLHPGLPKTGTTFLQTLLAAGGEQLAAAGVLFPGGIDGQFEATLDLTERNEVWGRTAAELAGKWDAVAEAARAHDGVSVISQELLSTAHPQHIARAMASLEGVETHVVLTLRDLGRQIPAEWQEGLKHGRTVRFSRFLERIFDEPEHQHTVRFWRAQDPVAVLQRWAAAIPPERVHLVINSADGGDRATLWQRFASVLGVPGDAVELPTSSDNASLGVVSAELLRRVNLRTPRSDNPKAYGNAVKRIYGGEVLAGIESPRIALPKPWMPRAHELTERWIEALDASGAQVVGDLADLQVSRNSGGNPDKLRARQLLVPALDATGELLATLQRMQAENGRLRREVRELTARLDGRSEGTSGRNGTATPSGGPLPGVRRLLGHRRCVGDAPGAGQCLLDPIA